MLTNKQKLLARLAAGTAADAIAAGAEAVNAAAERVRWPYVPPGHQSSVYQNKALWLGVIDPAIEGTRQALQKQLEALNPADAANVATARQIAADAQRDIEAAVAAALGI